MTVKVIGKGTRAGGDTFEYVPGVRFTDDLSCRDYDWLVVYDEMSVAETRAQGEKVSTAHP